MRWILPALTLVGMLVSGVRAGEPTVKESAEADRGAEVARLVREFRSSPEARERVVDRALQLGGDAPQQVLAAALEVTKPLVERYRAAYPEAARKLAWARRTEHKAEAAALRSKVRGLGRAHVKSLLEKEGWPAVVRLHQLLYVTPADVCAADASIKAMRDELAALDALRRRLQEGDERKKAPPRPKNWPKRAPWPPRQREPGLLDLVAEDEQVAALRGLANNDADEMAIRDNRAIEATLTPRERLGIRDANRVRMLLGVPAMFVDAKLCAAARDHCQDMKQYDFVSHVSPVAGKQMPWDRARRFGTTCKSENISFGGTSPQWIIQRWFVSPDHHINLLNPAYFRCGFGNLEQFWVLMLGT